MEKYELMFSVMRRVLKSGEYALNYPLRGEHDEIFAIGLESVPADSEDGKALSAAGWIADEGVGCWKMFT